MIKGEFYLEVPLVISLYVSLLPSFLPPLSFSPPLDFGSPVCIPARKDSRPVLADFTPSLFFTFFLHELPSLPRRVVNPAPPATSPSFPVDLFSLFFERAKEPFSEEGSEREGED